MSRERSYGFPRVEIESADLGQVDFRQLQTSCPEETGRVRLDQVLVTANPTYYRPLQPPGRYPPWFRTSCHLVDLLLNHCGRTHSTCQRSSLVVPRPHLVAPSILTRPWISRHDASSVGGSAANAAAVALGSDAAIRLVQRVSPFYSHYLYNFLVAFERIAPPIRANSPHIRSVMALRVGG